MGESAGGNLATTVCMMAKDRGGKMPVHQVLVYPYVMNSLKLSDATLYRRYPSYKTNADAIPLGKALGQWFWKYYEAPTTAKDPIRYQEPIKATVSQVRGLPPATVITDEIDVLHSEGEDYATKLKQAGSSGALPLFSGRDARVFRHEQSRAAGRSSAGFRGGGSEIGVWNDVRFRAI